MKFEINLSKDKVYAVAVSGGPDSIALLDILYKQGFSLIVCHVNYHHRLESDDEAFLVESLAKKYGYVFEKMDAYYHKEDGNFESWARDVRYSFFKSVCIKYNITHCFVAHHLDDLIETYILQKKRGYVNYYGLKEEVKIKDVFILRPLLNYRKQDLITYCQNNNLSFSIDITNLDTSLERNKIRKEIINNLNKEDVKIWLNKIDDDNNKIEKINCKIMPILKNKLSIQELKELSPEECDRLLYLFVNQHITYSLSKGNLSEIKRKLFNKSGNCLIELIEGIFLLKEYDCLKLVEIKEYNYELKVYEPSIVENQFIYFDLLTNPDNFYIKEDSYPLTIRNFSPNEKVKIGKTHKSINRILIDSKIPYLKRLYWPVIVNNKGEIIFVPRSIKDDNGHFVVKEL